jgi:hypothetical protein
MQNALTVFIKVDCAFYNIVCFVFRDDDLFVDPNM